MIEYSTGRFGLNMVLQLRGSVFPKAVIMALPNGILTVAIHFLFKAEWMAKGSSNAWVQVYSTFSFVLGFLLVFRTSNAYKRYWEGATIMNQVRGEWWNAVSSAIAFCNRNVDKDQEVERFQHCLIRLVSLMYHVALLQVSNGSVDNLAPLNLDGFEPGSFDILRDVEDRAEVILQWVQRLITDNLGTEKEGKIIVAPPPVASRIFQELSRGMVNLHNAIKIAECVFPFPYSQITAVMLCVNWCVQPVVCATLLDTWPWAGLLSAMSTLILWSIYYIALEIENPFGEEANDLPLISMQRSMNDSLWALLEPSTQQIPVFDFDRERDTVFKLDRKTLGISPLIKLGKGLEKPHKLGERDSNSIPDHAFADGPSTAERGLGGLAVVPCGSEDAALASHTQATVGLQKLEASASATQPDMHASLESEQQQQQAYQHVGRAEPAKSKAKELEISNEERIRLGANQHASLPGPTAISASKLQHLENELTGLGVVPDTP